jgi:hypothetical protein
MFLVQGEVLRQNLLNRYYGKETRLASLKDGTKLSGSLGSTSVHDADKALNRVELTLEDIQVLRQYVA